MNIYVDGLLAHGAFRTMKELRTVKNDNKDLKINMTNQIITTGRYNMPENKTTTNYTKTIIEDYMNFLND